MKIAAAALLYLSALVAANEIIAAHGEAAVLYVGAGLIGFIIVARDFLHDLFEDHRLPKMAALIATGALLSYLLNADAAKIAVASAAAFAASEAVDAVTYHAMRRLPWLERSNSSNVLSATVDTVVFLELAFGAVPAQLAVAQIACKVAGGLVYTLLLERRRAVLPRHA